MARPNDIHETSDAEDRIAEAIAAKVIEIVRRELGVSAPTPVELIDAREVARRSGFSRAWVYENAGRLGAVRVGDGRRPRLRFDARVVARVLEARSASRPVPDEPELPAGLAIHVCESDRRVPESERHERWHDHARGSSASGSAETEP